MPLKAIFLGSLGTIGETTGIHRRALEAAFDEEGIRWDWTRCGRDRSAGSCRSARDILEIAERENLDIDVETIHRRKTELFRELLGQVRIAPRPGLKKLLDATRAAGLDLALVTTASSEDVQVMLAAAGLSGQSFSFVGDASRAALPKPAPDIYLAALDALSLKPEEVLAVEDSPENTSSAEAAGIQCVGFPGAAHVSETFGRIRSKAHGVRPIFFEDPEPRLARRA